MLKLKNSGKYSVLIVLAILVGFVFLGSSSDISLSLTTTNCIKPALPYSSQTYIVHPPILIESDGEFGNYSFSGTGTRGDPYLIEGYSITATGTHSIAIEISGTNAFFIVNACYIVSDWVGIQLGSVADGTSKVIGNRINSPTGNGGAISVGYVENCTISGNIVTNYMQGIHLNHADGCTIVNNYFYDMLYQGINIRYSDSNNITYNRIKNAREHGIALVGVSSYNIVHNNILDGNTITDLYVIDGVPKGKPSSQGYDEGTDNLWYDNENQMGNAWSDYFGIGPYYIDGPSNSVDMYPKNLTDLTPFNLILTLSSIAIVLVGGMLFYRYFTKRGKEQGFKIRKS